MASPGEPSSPPIDTPPAGQEFPARAIRQLRSQFADRTAALSDGQLTERLHSAAVRAGGYGLHSEEQALCFATAGFLLGEDFDSDPRHAWAAEILSSPELSAGERAAMLVALAELLCEEQQAEAEAADGESR